MTKRSQQQWFELFDAHEQSGLSAAEFCRQHQLCAKYFSLRKRQLGWTVPSIRALLPVMIESEERGSLNTLQLTWGDTVLSLPPDISPRWLSQLIRTLQ